MIECAFHRKSVCTEEELKWIAVTDDPHIRREATHGTPTWIWPLVVDSELYVRPNDRTSSRRYKAAMTTDVGRITAGGAQPKPNRRGFLDEVQEQSNLHR
jgi:hypothetical protein